jgi:hypothetical protein
VSDPKLVSRYPFFKPLFIGHHSVSLSPGFRFLHSCAESHAVELKTGAGHIEAILFCFRTYL